MQWLRRLRFALLLLPLLLTGCLELTDPETSMQHSGETVAWVTPGQGAGQSLVSRRARLESISLWLEPGQGEAAPGPVTLRVYPGPDGVVPLRVVTLPAAGRSANSPLAFHFDPLPDPPSTPYYVELDVALGSLGLRGRGEDIYPGGSAYHLRQPLDADLAFTTTYDYGPAAVLEDAANLLRQARLAIPLAVVLLLPGWLLARRVFKGQPPDERLGLAIGLSLALPPVSMTWTTLLGMRWSQAGVVIAAAALVSLFFVDMLVSRRGAGHAPDETSPPTPLPGGEGGSASPDAAAQSVQSVPEIRCQPSPPTPLPRGEGGGDGPHPTGRGAWHAPEVIPLPGPPPFRSETAEGAADNPPPVGEGRAAQPPGVRSAPSPLALLLAIFLATLAVRLLMVRDLAAPAWVDSVHHGVITRLVMEQGGYPSSYAPYLQIDTARYHAGFHSLLAFFLWLSRMELAPGMLLFGQILNALIVFPVYLLALDLTDERKAALWAALVAGMFTPMPAYYTSWGRYTQLAGLLILPAAFHLVRRAAAAWQAGGLRQAAGPLLLAGLAGAGIFLTHYRVAVFLACLLAADLVVQAGAAGLSRRFPRLAGSPVPPHTGPYALAGALAGGLAVILVLPWLPETFATLFVPKLSAWAGGNSIPFEGFAWSFLTSAWGRVSLYLAGAGLAWGLLRRRAFPVTLGLWGGLLFFSANLEPLGLPGGGFITNLSVAISLFMPLAVAGGFIPGDLWSLATRWLAPRPAPLRLAHSLAWLALGIAVMFGAGRALLPILRPLTFLVRQADLAGLAWAQANIPAGQTVLTNPTGWGYGFYQGADGGYWITPSAGLPGLPPPVLYGLDNDLVRVGAVNRLVQQAQELASDPPALHAWMLENDIGYIFLGARGGILSPRLLRQSGQFSLLFGRDGVWIFGVKP